MIIEFIDLETYAEKYMSQCLEICAQIRHESKVNLWGEFTEGSHADYYVIASIKNEVVGAVAMSECEELSFAEVEGVVVKPSFQGQKIYKSILQHIEKNLRDKGIKSIQMFPLTEDSKLCHLRLGFFKGQDKLYKKIDEDIAVT